MPSFDTLRPFGLSERDTVLRRFMPWLRFKAVFETQTLYFASASSFDDKREGHPTNLDERERERLLRKHGFNATQLAMAAEANSATAAHNQAATVVSCWTVELADNNRMWKEYGRLDEAVMVETTVGRLLDCLGEDFLIVHVQYIDIECDRIPQRHSLFPFFFKDKSYNWEKEVRIIADMDLGAKFGTARIVPVRLEDLVTRVVVSPTAPDGFAETVESIVEKVSSRAQG